MKKVSEKWQLLVDKLIKQHRKPHIKTFRDFLTTSHIVEKYVAIMEEAKSTINYSTTEKLIILLILLKRDYMTPTEISKLTFRSVDTINKSIDGLKKKGIIKNVQLKTDRRIRRTILTEKGLEITEQILPTRELIFHQAMGCFNNDEVKIFSALLEKLRENIIQVINDTDKKYDKFLKFNSNNDPFSNF